ncbi:MAG: peptide chain release factor N(5)-glutamine methyltransferase [Candidatus Omnitrophica bacterium]|nr:peptide chain release factor N(5)-glutamine methyltransferase [Candidatus Omnitrophota bacterium]
MAGYRIEHDEYRRRHGVNEAELVLTSVLNCDRLSLYLNKNARLEKEKCALLSAILKRRAVGEPVQYILGETEFMGLKFKVDKRALIPRPETEILAETAINALKQAGIACPKVLDLGTGSGCIAVSIAKTLSRSEVWGSDISIPALQLARENACSNNAGVKFIRSDIFEAFKSEDDKFDLIVSNPPYVSTGEFQALAKEISFEPQIALSAGADGLDFYRLITRQAASYLKDGGLLIFEVGRGQAVLVKEMFDKKVFDHLSPVMDYNNIERVVMARKRTA